MAKLIYQGHASFKIVTSNNRIIYIDPYAGEGYDDPADLVLITHEHFDHNAIHLIHEGKRCIVIRAKDCVSGDIYRDFEYFGIRISSKPAYNSHHEKGTGVGFLIEVDGVKVYHAGDTDRIQEFKDLAREGVDYALLPIDGFYTMSPEDAAASCLDMDAKHLIPMHTNPKLLWDIKQVMKVYCDRAILVRPNDVVELKGE